MRMVSIHCAAASLLAGALLPAAPALAQDAAPAAEEAAEDSAYTRLVQEGVAEFARGNWEESYLLFSDAHALQPNARTYRGMGMSAYEARQYVRAFVNLQASLGDERRALSEAQRAEVQALIGKTERFIARMKLVLKPADAQVEVDARSPVYDKDGVLLLDRGAHELIAKAPGHATAIRRLVVRAGEEGTFEVRLSPEGGAAAGEPIAADAPLDGVGDAPARNYLPTLIAGGTAVVFAGAALTLYLLASGEADDIRSECNGACTPEEVDTKIADGSIEGMQTTSGVFWGLSGAAAITAGVLYYLEVGSAEAAAAEPAVGVAVGPTGVQLHGRF